MSDIQVPVSEDLQDFYEDRFPSADSQAQDAFEELGK
jgi:hypothetical protein